MKEQIVAHLSNYLEVKETHSLNYNNCNNVRNELMHLIRANSSSTTTTTTTSSSSSAYSNKRRQHESNQDHGNETTSMTCNDSYGSCNMNEMNFDACDNTSIATTKTSSESTATTTTTTTTTTSSSSVTSPLVADSNNNSTFPNVRKSLRTSKSYDNLRYV